MKRNIVEFDVMKFALMIFVIAGHLAPNNIVTPSANFVDRFLSHAFIGCGMPLFFFMSGYLSYQGFHAKTIRQILERNLRIIWPAVTTGILFAMLGWAIGDYCGSEALSYPYHHFRGLWFTQALFIVSSIVGVIYRVVKSGKGRIAALIVVYLAFLFGPTENRFINLALPMHMFPYFIFGLAVKKFGNDLWKNKFIALPCGIVFCIVCLFEGDIRHNGMGFYWASTLWRDVLLTWHGFSTMIAHNIVGMTGIIFALWLVKNTIDSLPQGGGGGIAVYGRTSLGVYVLHGWFLVQLGKVSVMPLHWYFKWPIAICIFFAMHYVVVLIRRNRIGRLVMFGEKQRGL